jgi:hypothetical protein
VQRSKRSSRRLSVVGLRKSSLWLLSGILVAIWLTFLLLDGVSVTGLALMIVEVAVILSLLLSLSERDSWKPTVLLFLGGLALQIIELMVVQTLPQHADFPLDSITYDLNAQAISEHWRGVEVVAEDHYLWGLYALGQDVWLPTDWLQYASVFGSRSFLYQIYVGIFYFLDGPQQSTVILSHTVLQAALAPVVYNLSSLLFNNRRLGMLAGSLTLVDLNYVAVGAFLLRDSLITLLMALAIWTTVLVIRKPEAYYPMVVLVTTLLGLSLLRYHVLTAFWVAVGVGVMLLTYYYRRGTRWLLAVLVPGYTVLVVLLALKDSLAAFITVVALWAAVLIVRGQRAYYPVMALVVLVAALLGLSLFDPQLRLLGLKLYNPDLVDFSLAAGVATFLVAVTWRAAAAIVGQQRAYYPIVAVVVPVVALLGGLPLLRYDVLAIFWLAASVAVVVAIYHRGTSRRLLAVLVLSLVGGQALYSPSSFLDPIPEWNDNIQVRAKILQEQASGDPTTFEWLQSLREGPPLALTKTVAHTLFGPYPWVPFAYGLNYGSTELFYPGTVMYIMGLPFLFVALWRLIRSSPGLIRGSPELLVILIWASLIVLEYIASQGEFSTRQRVFMMPLFWTLVAFGVEQVRVRFGKMRTAGVI